MINLADISTVTMPVLLILICLLLYKLSLAKSQLKQMMDQRVSNFVHRLPLRDRAIVYVPETDRMRTKEGQIRVEAWNINVLVTAVLDLLQPSPHSFNSSILYYLYLVETEELLKWMGEELESVHRKYGFCRGNQPMN